MLRQEYEELNERERDKFWSLLDAIRGTVMHYIRCSKEDREELFKIVPIDDVKMPLPIDMPSDNDRGVINRIKENCQAGLPMIPLMVGKVGTQLFCISGYKRWFAAKELGWTTVTVMTVECDSVIDVVQKRLMIKSV